VMSWILIEYDMSTMEGSRRMNQQMWIRMEGTTKILVIQTSSSIWTPNVQ
jgi:hypothetical protein